MLTIPNTRTVAYCDTRFPCAAALVRNCTGFVLGGGEYKACAAAHEGGRGLLQRQGGHGRAVQQLRRQQTDRPVPRQLLVPLRVLDRTGLETAVVVSGAPAAVIVGIQDAAWTTGRTRLAAMFAFIAFRLTRCRAVCGNSAVAAKCLARPAPFAHDRPLSPPGAWILQEEAGW